MSVEIPRFGINIELYEELNTKELWPDGDGPPDPTVLDVIALIGECGGSVGILRDWCLGPPEITVIAAGVDIV